MNKRKKKKTSQKRVSLPARTVVTDNGCEIVDFLIEDFRFSRSYISAVDRLFPEEKKKFESSFAFHRDRMDELAKRFNAYVKTYDGFDYIEGLPVTPLNADDFESSDDLIVAQTIEPTILNSVGHPIRQGTVLLSKKEAR